MPESILIGIDGGGTHSTAVAAYPDGRNAAVAKGGGLNFHNIGVEAVRSHLEAMVRELCQKTGCRAEKVCVGMAALDAPADEATTALFTGILTADQLDLQSDAYIALQGFTQGKPGVIVICGTGSMLLMLDGEGKQHAAGGWGYLLGDAGSGYTLAREGLLAAIDYAEGLASETPLLADAMDYFDAETPRGLIDRIYAPEMTQARLAGFARYVLQWASEENPVACGILAYNMKRLARLAARLIDNAPDAARVGLYGGIFCHSELARSYFARALEELSPKASVSLPEYPPELGALIHLFHQKGTLHDSVLNIMKKSYEEYRK